MIHPTAIIQPGAELDSDVEIGPHAFIGPHVRIGSGTTVGPNAVIDGWTEIGRDNRIFHLASVGGIPQDLKYKGEQTWLRIGDRNIIREFSTLHPGTVTGDNETTVGNGNLFMAYCHVAHDCHVGNGVVMANGATLAGHVRVDDFVILGGLCAVHQFVRIGAHSMTAICSVLLADLPPFVMCQGQPAVARSMNYEGLRRRGFSPERISAVKAMHKALYRRDLTLQAAQESIADLRQAHPESEPDVQMMLSFLAQTSPQRGIVR